MGYASDQTSINEVLKEGVDSCRYKLFKVDLINAENTSQVISQTNPDLIMHLAAESHR